MKIKTIKVLVKSTNLINKIKTQLLRMWIITNRTEKVIEVILPIYLHWKLNLGMTPTDNPKQLLVNKAKLNYM